MQNSESTYIPGVCNINREEIKKRQLAGYFGAGISLILFVVLIFLQDERLFRVVLFFPVFFAVLGFIQARSKFCVAYGAAGKQNATDGNKTPLSIEEKESIKADKAHARKLILRSVAIALLVTVVTLLIP